MCTKDLLIVFKKHSLILATICLGFFSINYIYFKDIFFFPSKSFKFIYDYRNVDYFIDKNYLDNHPKKDEINKMLLNNIPLLKNKLTDKQKVKLLSDFILEKSKGTKSEGVLSDKMDAFEQYSAIINQKAKPHCVNYAVIYNLFASSLGLKSRQVSLAGNKVDHIFTETYISEEKQWALTDIMYSNVLNKIDGKYVTAVHYKDKSGNCILKNNLCSEYLASHTKFYNHSAYKFGYPFSKKSKFFRTITPWPETVISNSQTNYLLYIINFTFLYLGLILLGFKILLFLTSFL